MKTGLKRWAADVALKSTDRTLGLFKRRDPDLAAPITTNAFLRTVIAPALEIGPFDNPCLQGDEIFYFDVLDQEGLKQRAREIPERNPETCPYVDYVSPVADLEVIDRPFKSVFSSHAIEHQPDLVRHLKGVRRILDRDGAYYLIIPDKRYCFDHFLPESGVDEILAARGRMQHTESKIREHLSGRAHNNPKLHWLGYHGAKGGMEAELPQAVEAHQRGEYVDVHAWQFTPTSFRRIIDQLSPETHMRTDRIHDTMVGAIEFMAVLRPI